MKHLARTITILALLALTASLALAEGELSLVMEAQEEVEIINQEGKKETQYIEPGSVIPGDVVLYTIHYHNQGDKPAEAVFITNPIPENMQYLNEITPFSDTVTTFSIDGGKTFDTSDKLFFEPLTFEDVLTSASKKNLGASSSSSVAKPHSTSPPTSRTPASPSLEPRRKTSNSPKTANSSASCSTASAFSRHRAIPPSPSMRLWSLPGKSDTPSLSAPHSSSADAP